MEWLFEFFECFSRDEFGREGVIITSNFAKKMLEKYALSTNDEEGKKISSCLELALRLGIDIENLVGNRHGYFSDVTTEILKRFVSRQRSIYQQFDIVKNGCSVRDLQKAIESGTLDINACDRGGLFLVHLVSVYDRVDILEYLVDNTEDCLTKLDRQSRSVLVVARSTRAINETEWIEKRLATKTISLFLQSNFRRRKARLLLKTSILGFKKFQAVYRGYKVRQKMKGFLFIYAATSLRFQLIWSNCINLKIANIELQCWISIREYFLDFAKAIDLTSLGKDTQEEIIDTMDKLDTAMNVVQDETSLYSVDNDDESEVIDVQTIDKLTKTHAKPTSETFVNIQYTSHVAKWLKYGDPKNRDFFVRRIRQLSAGERSRILAKRLKGSKTTIFETYLEQISGFRILWTTEGNNILVWYIAKHDAVSRLVERIDDSQSRSSRQLASAVHLIEEEDAAVPDKKNAHRIILDPLENVPLKVYEVPVHNIGSINDKTWIPCLKLTDEERDVIETNGTALLLDRSGTGKTVCICNRMDYDSQQMANDPSFSQLFIARSRKLCKYVSEAIVVLPSTTFTIFDTLLSQLQNQLPNTECIKNSFPRSNRMTFDRFKSEVYNRNHSIDPLLVWTSIRSFIKGSIEATKNLNNAIDKEEFLSSNLFGIKRCRLTLNQREEIYCIYERYRNYMQGSGLWDDCDRITALLQRLQYCKTSNHELYHQLRKSKIYVDEVQDYTQAEILLFFYLSGPGNLFFARDPAQSVVEGVEFRFEDIRSVEYHIATDHNNLILQKPKIVNENFRSHAGIINTAGAILSCMFGAFPHSAKQLKEDQGVFLGPRPSVFYKVHDNKLSSLISNQLNVIVVLVHDSNVSHCRRSLDGYPLVYGIRAEKGLEFKSVIIMNFFTDLPSNIQKPWRDLLLGRANEDFQYVFPEVEGQLKILYTGVTRCIQQLFFAETTGSIAGDAFVRWITTTTISRNKRKSNTEKEIPLATRSNLGDVQVIALTNDEWISSGIENAEAAEDYENNDLLSAKSLLDKAIYCFQQANEVELARKARVHRSSIQFRLKLRPAPARSEENQDGDGDGDIENDFTTFGVKAAGIVENLVRENLLNEAEGLCESILPRMSGYTEKQLQVNKISKVK